MNQEDTEYMLSLIKLALEVDSDEYEGQQTIDLSKINLCSVDYTDETGHLGDIFSGINVGSQLTGTGAGTTPGNGIDSDNIIKGSEILSDAKPYTGSVTQHDNLSNMTFKEINNVLNDKDIIKILTEKPEDILNSIPDMKTGSRVIIEFADLYIKDSEVKYNIFVKPGDSLNENTIIGEVEQNGVMKPIRSIFSLGTVMGNADNSDFYRLYPSKCNRHIVIDNYQTGTLLGIDTSVLEQTILEFRQESCLYLLITDNLCYSTLPLILLKRRPYNRLYDNPLSILYSKHKNGVEIYNDYKKQIEYINEWYKTQILLISSEDNIKKTNGNPEKLNALGKLIINLREVRYNMLLGLYNTRYDQELCKYDKSLKDCKMLAIGIKNNDSANGDLNFKIGDTDYYSYYMNLLCRINGANNESDNIYSEEYFDVLSEIIAYRLQYEKHDIIKIHEEWLTLFYKELDPRKKNSFNIFLQMNIDIPNNDLTYNNVVMWITDHMTTTQNDGTTYIINQLANIYLFIRKYSQGKYNIDNLMSNYIKDVTNSLKVIERFKKCKNDLTPFIKNFSDKFIEKLNIQEFINLIKSLHNYIFTNTLAKKFSKDEQKNAYIKENLLYCINLDLDKYNLAIGTLLTYYSVYDYLSLYLDDLANENIIKELTEDYMFILHYSVNKDIYKSYNLILKEITDISGNGGIQYLIKHESDLLERFWSKILNIYNKLNLQTVTDKFNNIANSLSEYALWPQPASFYVNGYSYLHYLFLKVYPKKYVDEDDIGTINSTRPKIPTSWPAPPPILRNDFPENELDIHVDEITYIDSSYWRKYFSLATIISTPFITCGLDLFVPAGPVPVPLPCIFNAINSVYIQLFDIVIVFGIAIRGLYISPIVLYVNASNNYASVMTPLIGQVKQLKNLLAQKIQNIEQIPIQSIANGFITNFERENRGLLNEIKEYEAYANNLKSLKVKNQEQIKKDFQWINKSSKEKNNK